MESLPEPPRDDGSLSGFTVLDTLSMPEEDRRFITWLTRQREVSLDEVARRLEADEAAASTRLSDLIERGFVQQVATMDGPRYQPKMAAKPNRRVAADIWKALD
jgi:predicted transcriptional regulator